MSALANRKVVWLEAPSHAYIGELRFQDGAVRTVGGAHYALTFTEAIYEAIEVSEYNLTFMEAWVEMKKGKTVERDMGKTWGARMYLSSGMVKTSPNESGVTTPPIHEEFIEAKYRVVEGA